jgi:predicted XRE-type DNA-binding protein
VSSKYVDYKISGKNVFEDLGLPDAPELRVKARLAHRISQIIDKRDMTQTQAAAVLGIDQPKVSALVRGRLEKFSIERLCDFLRSLGCDVDIQVTEKKKPSPGKLTVSGGPLSESR